MAVGWTVAKAVPLPPKGVVPDIAGRVEVEVMVGAMEPAYGPPPAAVCCCALKVLSVWLCAPCPDAIVVVRVTAGRFACAITAFDPPVLETAPTVAPFSGDVSSGVDGNTDTRALLRRSGKLKVVIPSPMPHVKPMA